MPPLSEKPRPTIHDVAAALGMAKSTVSKGLSGKGTLADTTRERILKVAGEMGYEPHPIAQRLANKGDNRLVYLCSTIMDVGIATEKVLSIQVKLRKLRLQVPIYSLASTASGDEQLQADEISDLCRQQPRAIVYANQGWQPSVLPLLQRYQENGGIVVSYDSSVPLHCDQVIFDREHTSYQTARYLIERGHRRLGINLPAPTEGVSNRLSNHVNPRLLGFCRAIEEAGLDLSEQWFYMPHVGYEKGGRELAAQFLARKNRPTGMCIVNDYSALAFMTEVRDAGIKIPDDISVIGHDNQEVAYHCPVPLTSAVQPTEEIAQAVVDLLVARLEGQRSEPLTVTIRGGIAERQSVAIFGYHLLPR